MEKMHQLKQLLILIVFLATPVIGSHHSFIISNKLPGQAEQSINLNDDQRLTSSRVRRSTGDDSESNKPTINELLVVSKIASRFATTNINSDLVNGRETDVEARFVVQIPDTAFISNFSIIIDGVEEVAEVKSKAEAQEEYEAAQEQNRTAGHVSQNPRVPQMAKRGFELFTVSVNVKAESSVYFKLQYQQLLERKFGLYENRISVRPNQTVSNLRVEIYIYEPQGITDLAVFEPSLSNSIENQDTRIERVSDSVREIIYEPSQERQALVDVTGNLGDLIVRYDVNHDNDVGLVLRENDFFVHFFSPNEENLAVLGKNIIFVIDISGSMAGDKMTQTRTAMVTILDQLYKDDRFMLLLFDDELEFWPEDQELVGVTSNSIKQAKDYAREKLKARGGTDINTALIEAALILHEEESVRGKDMIVFLTDGQPSSGETRPAQIIKNVEAVPGHVSIFSLGFGSDLDYDLLQSLSFRTKGFPKKIYLGVDAATQLKDFFQEISAPLLYDIDINYQSNAVVLNTLTTTSFAQYFKGSELVVAGKIQDSSLMNMDVRITGESSDRYSIERNVPTTQVVVPSTAANAMTSNFIEKLYIHLKIKDLIKEMLILDDTSAINETRYYALQLALDYNLVTPLTSMIVVEQPEERNDFYSYSSSGIRTKMASIPSMADPTNTKVLVASVAACLQSKHVVLTLVACLLLACFVL